MPGKKTQKGKPLEILLFSSNKKLNEEEGYGKKLF